ncbi:MAG: MFS transporter [Bowdeniella nasicola]|nr:MFS transporter [Bowdeniella nasicola]
MLPETTALQRRILVTLSLAQICSALGAGAVLAVGNVMAKDITGMTTLSGISSVAVFTSGAIAAVPMANLAQRVGRRRALSLGLLLGCIGASIMIITPLIGLVGLLTGSFFLGFSQATNFQARFAATDLAPPSQRGRHLALVVWMVTIGAVAGPNLIAPGAKLGAHLGLPSISGPFVFSLMGMLGALIILQVGLRPDPLQYAQRLRAADFDHDMRDDSPPHPANAPMHAPRISLRTRLATIRTYRQAEVGIWGIWVAQLVMVAIMSMTPVHMAGDVDASQAVDSFPLIGLTISLHIAGMYALSPLFGWMADRFGHRATLICGQLQLAISALLVVGWPHRHGIVVVALVFLGLGWSASLVAGSAMLTAALPLSLRVMAQGLSDSGMAAMGALGAGLSGPALAAFGYAGLGAISLVILAASATYFQYRFTRH